MPFKNRHFRPGSRLAPDPGKKVAGGVPSTTSVDTDQDARRIGVAT
jgi:hypothetical protein